MSVKIEILDYIYTDDTNTAIDWNASVVGELDITDNSDFPLAITFQISDFKDLTSTSGDYSKTFKVPATKNNNNLLKHIYVPNLNNNSNITQKKPCRILFNNLYSLVGLLQIDGAGGYGQTPSYYNCVFFGSNLSWSDRIQDAYMNNIDWGSDGEGIDLKYNKSSIVATWEHTDSDNASNSPIVYPITSYGDYNETGDARTIQLLNTLGEQNSNLSPAVYTGHYGFFSNGNTYSTPTPVADWRPSIFVKTTLDRIFSGIGYKISSAFMETSMFKKLVWLLPNFKYNDPDQVVLDYSVRSNFENGVSMTATGAGFQTFTEDGVQMLDIVSISENSADYYYNSAGAEEFDMQASNLTVTLNSAFVDMTNDYVTIQEYGNYKISLNGLQSKLARGFKGGNIAQALSSIDTRVLVEIQTVGHSGVDSWVVVSATGVNTLTPENDVGNQLVDDTVDANTDYVDLSSIVIDRYLNKGDKIRLRIGVRLSSDTDNSQTFAIWMFFKAKNNSNFKIELNPEHVAYGQTYNLKDVISKDYKQIDFIKGVAHAFNLQMNTDESTKTVNIEPFDDFYKPYSYAIDWTYKLDRSNEISDKWISSDLKRSLVFKYKSDDKDLKVKRRGEDWFDKIEDEYPYRETLPNTFKRGDSTFENPFFAGTYSGKDQDTVQYSPRDTAYSSILWNGVFNPSDLARPDKGYDFLPRLLYWNKYSPTGMPSPFGTFGMQKFAAVQTWSSSVEYLNANADHAAQDAILSNIYPQATMVNRDSTTSPNLAYGNVNVRDYDDSTGVYTSYSAGKGLYETYYRNMINGLKESPRLRTVSVSLKITDIVNLDFTRLVYIDGVYWRINKIIDYKPNKNESTKVELIEWFQSGAFAASTVTFGTSGSDDWNDDGSVLTDGTIFG